MISLLEKLVIIFVFAVLPSSNVCGTIDMNLNVIEYLATRLDPFECRHLIAALHYRTYELPKSIAAAERRIDPEIPCLRQLLHWNSRLAEGKGKTHEAIVHRLRQINRNDLADWLGKTAFKELGKELDRMIAKPFDEEIVGLVTDLSYPESGRTSVDAVFWTPFDGALMAILLGLLGTLLTLICFGIVLSVKRSIQRARRKNIEENKETTDRNEHFAAAERKNATASRRSSGV